MSVDVFEELLKAPETALADAQKGLHKGLQLRVPRLVLEFLLHIRQYGPQNLDDGNNESAKGHGPNMEAAEVGGRGRKKQLKLTHCTCEHTHILSPQPGPLTWQSS